LVVLAAFFPIYFLYSKTEATKIMFMGLFSYIIVIMIFDPEKVAYAFCIHYETNYWGNPTN